MRLCSSVTAVLVVLSVVACGTQEESAEDLTGWVGTVVTEGNVTTVINESGSVWGGAARLVEEASIGVESGGPEYMFGRVPGMYADGERIFVIDQQVPVVRVYDYDGRHLRDMGREGQGPGEFTNACDITGMPDGRIFVLGPSANAGRINVFGADGQPLGQWPLPSRFQCRAPTVAGSDGLLWLFAPIVHPEFRIAIGAVGPEGPVGEPMPVPDLQYERWTFTSRGREYEGIPWAPRISWTISPVGALVVGASDEFNFQVRYPDGRMTVIEQAYEPVPVSDAERDYWTLELPRRIDDETFRWDGRLPESKRPYDEFLATYSGEIWVLREGLAKRLPDCDPSELVEGRRGPMPQRCYEQTWMIDAFEIDGRYLGQVEVPDGKLPGGDFAETFVRGDTVIATAMDEAGTIMVKRYRLVRPGEGA